MRFQIPVAAYAGSYSTKMSKGVNIAFVLLLGLVFKECYGDCNNTHIKNIDVCTYNIECRGTVRDVDLTFKCDQPGRTESVHLILKNASEIRRTSESYTFSQFCHRLKTIELLIQRCLFSSTLPPQKPIFSNRNLSYTARIFCRLENLTKLDISYNMLIDVEGLFASKQTQQTEKSCLV
ncbi:hypothetical protein EVAR_100246_1 [Eumeta japonica]|uniref:Uncharacterized protein n=1 Tax=Eumeta variegata TaxID=151549 RepID=A0A4C2A528_EUMVA|nr:hypothetical protein EVAR_100246_1 [Eumeta japonica]